MPLWPMIRGQTYFLTIGLIQPAYGILRSCFPFGWFNEYFLQKQRSKP